MTTLTNRTHFLEAVQPFLGALDPLEALKQAGFTFAGEVGDLARDPPPPFADPRLLEALRRTYGPPPPARISVRPDRRRVRPTALSLSGYRAIVSGERGLLNDVLAELWRVGTIPNDVGPAFTSAHLIKVSELRALCDGVPDDATAATLHLVSAPTASTTHLSPGTIHFDLPFRLALDSSSPTSLDGVIGAEIPLDFQIAEVPKNVDIPDSPLVPRIRLTAGAITGVTAVVRVSPGSTVQAKMGGLPALGEKCATALQDVLYYLIYQRIKLVIPAQIGLGSTFPNSLATVNKAGAVMVSSGNDFAIAGINVGDMTHLQTVDPSLLVTEELPHPPSNLHGVIDQAFASDVLSAAIASGDMAAFFNRVLERESPLPLAPIVVTGGAVTFDAGMINVAVDCEWRGACNFDTDLSFTANVSGTPSVANGRLTIQSSGVDFDLDTWDAIKCQLLAIPVLGSVLTAGVEAIFELYSSFSVGQVNTYPVGTASDPLLGSEKVVKLEMTQAALGPGTLRLDGQARLIDDPLRTFVYLRVVEGRTRFDTTPVAGATVELIEVHDFAPIPPTDETDVFTEKSEIVTSTSYQPLPDLSLSTEPTDNTGYVRFAVVCPRRAGILTTLTTTISNFDSSTSSTTKHEVIQEGWTDLAITIKGAEGRVLTTRRLVGTNVVNRRLGTRDNPIVVVLEREVVGLPG